MGHHIPRQEQLLSGPESRDDLRRSSQMAAPRSTRDILRTSQAMRRANSSSERRRHPRRAPGRGGRDSPAKVRSRKGVCVALSRLSDPGLDVSLATEDTLRVLSLLAAHGLADPVDAARSSSVSAGRDVVERHGSDDAVLSKLMPFLEGVLRTGKAEGEKAPGGVAAADARKTGAVILLGSAALHLADDYEKINGAGDMLLGALVTPLEVVQYSIATCLSKLMGRGRIPERKETMIAGLLEKCFAGKSLARRRGAAYGLSAAVHGGGYSALRTCGVVDGLEEALAPPPAAWQMKEGALFAVELLSVRLGLLLEPYVLRLLLSLLRAFSDGNNHVRAAAGDTAGVIMARLSTHGVRLVLPAILGALDDPSWRTKAASIYMLGSMSRCAPKQLGSCLPRVVPRLVEATADTHPKVKAASEDALATIMGAVRYDTPSRPLFLLSTEPNPALPPQESGNLGHAARILRGPQGPRGRNPYGPRGPAGDRVRARHRPPPGLALLMPILIRGLKDRSALNKRYAALITGNMCSMIDDPVRDFGPYLGVLLPGLKATVVDPIPDERTTASKCQESLTR